MSSSYLDRLQTRLTKVQTAIEAAIDNPASYNIAGAISVSNRSLAELREEEANLLWRILQARGINGKVYPDYSGTGNSGAPLNRPST